MNDTCSHRPEEAKYLCCTIKCDTFLCKNCLEGHKQSHKKPFDLSSIKPLSELRQNYNKRIQLCGSSFEDDIQKLHQCRQDLNDAAEVEEGIKIINLARDELIRHVKKYFKAVEERFRADMGKLKVQMNGMLEELEATITSALEDVSTLKDRMDRQENEAIIDCMRVDFDYEIKRYDSMFANLTDNMFSFSLNNNVLDDIAGKMSQYLVIQVKGRKINDIDDSMLGRANRRDSIASDASVKSKRSYASKGISVQESLAERFSVHSAAKEKSVQVSEGMVLLPPSFQNIPQTLPTEPAEVDTFVDFQVKLPDFFGDYTKNKLLHFFEGGTNNLYLYHISQLNSPPGDLKFEKLTLAIDFSIAKRHRSIITPQGDIFVGGGTTTDKGEIADFYRVNLNASNLVKLKPMNVARKSFGICYLDGFIYIIGGANKAEGFIKKCEKYSIADDKWYVIADMQKSASSPAVCAFRDRYLYKFGGLYNNGQLNNKIEKYDTEKDAWYMYEFQNIDFTTLNFRLLWLTGACQINEKQIYVFGGCEENDNPSTMSFLFEVDDSTEAGYKIKKVNVKELVRAGGFWCPQILVDSNHLIGLQNVMKTTQEAYEERRDIVIFDSEKWINLKRY
jgi:hypothetical protein